MWILTKAEHTETKLPEAVVGEKCVGRGREWEKWKNIGQRLKTSSDKINKFGKSNI